jgi:hypothetical protein
MRCDFISTDTQGSVITCSCPAYYHLFSKGNFNKSLGCCAKHKDKMFKDLLDKRKWIINVI